MNKKNILRIVCAVLSLSGLIGLLSLFIWAGGIPAFAAQPRTYAPSHCLYGLVNSTGTGSNELNVVLHEGSGCSLPNSSGSMYYKIHSSCPGEITEQDRYGTIPFQALSPNQRLSAPGAAASYCISCADGRIIGFPQFTITLSITGIDASAIVNGHVRTDIPLAMSYDSPQTTASGKAGNYLGLTGGLHC